MVRVVKFMPWPSTPKEISSPPYTPPPFRPVANILWIEDWVGFGEEAKYLLPSGVEPWFLRRVDRSLVITPTELPRSIWSLYKYLGACRQTVVGSSCVLLLSVKQMWTGYPSIAVTRRCGWCQVTTGRLAYWYTRSNPSRHPKRNF